MKFKFFAGLALATLAFASCDDNTDGIGTSVVNNMDHLEVSTDTFTVASRSIIVDSVLSRNTIGYQRPGDGSLYHRRLYDAIPYTGRLQVPF